MSDDSTHRSDAPIYLSCDQVREIDRRAAADYGIPTLILMENAGRGAAQFLSSLGIHGRVVICCGKGNNGGDGLVIARRLHQAKIDVKVLLFAAPSDLSVDAAANWRRVQQAGVPAEAWPTWEDDRLRQELCRAEWAVDALYGTGLKGSVRPPHDRAIDSLNGSGVRLFAVDIPSGLDGDTGAPLGPTIRADHTATFVAPKRGFANPGAATWLGKIHVIDIGVPQPLIDDVINAGAKPTSGNPS